MRQSDVASALIEEQGTLYSEEMGAHIAHDTPQELFHWLIGTIMLSARIGSHQAVKGCHALRETGFHKIDAILGRDYWDLVKVLNENGYARYDESTARYLRDTAEWVRDTYGGDLRRLRDEAGDGAAIRKALQGAKGLGKTGADIFAREAQLVWDALYPSLDGPALKAAGELGLPQEPDRLVDLAGSRERYVRLVAALTRVALDGPSDHVKELAS